MRNDAIIKLTLLPILCLVLQPSLFAFPTKAELAKAETVVDELVGSSIVELKAGKKKASEVADDCFSYVREAETVAGKVVLTRLAFKYHLEAGDCERAAEDFSALANDVDDIPHGTLAKWSEDAVAIFAREAIPTSWPCS